MSEDKQILLNNLDKVHTTEMGIERIKKNLQIDTDNVVGYCVQKIKKSNCEIKREGKNWYAFIDNVVITVNAKSYTIITAHKSSKC